MRKMLVTGGKGFLGGALVDTLIARGDEVVVIDNQSSQNIDYHINAKAEYLDQDVANLNYFSQLAEEHGRFDAIFHLAAVSNIRESFERPALAILDNVLGTANVLEYARFSRPHKVVIASTCAVYGLGEDYPFTEDSEVLAANPYSITKGHAEDYAKMYSNVYQVETCVLRFFNIYGDRANKESVLEKLFEHKQGGSEFLARGAGLQTRDYIHVDDAVSALIKASESGIGLSGEVFNIGSGKDYSVNQLVEMVLGPDVKVNSQNMLVGEVEKAKADISKAKEKLKWKPRKKLESYIEKRLNELTKD